MGLFMDVTEAQRTRREQGLTLVEIMVVVVILAGLALLAVPALTKDNTEAAFRKYVHQFLRDVQRAHMEAISSREDRSILLYSDRYTVNAVLPGSTVFSLLYNRGATAEVEIFAILNLAADPGRSYTIPGSALAGGEEIRFAATGGVEVLNGGAYSNSSVSVFFRTTHGSHKARVVIYQSTSFAKVHEGW